jgi:RNA recognition motif-containing protein
MKIYVGNLSFDTTEDELRQAFEACGGQPESVDLIKDKITGNSRGFAFVEVPSRDAAQTAIRELNGKQLNGRALSVNEARPKSEGASASRGGGNSRRW